MLRSGEAIRRGAFQRPWSGMCAASAAAPKAWPRRGHDLPDFLHFDWDTHAHLRPGPQPSGAGMGARMEVFAEIADRAGRGLLPRGRGARRTISST